VPVGSARAVAVAQEELAVLVGLTFPAGAEPPTAVPPPPATLLPALAVDAVPVPVPAAPLVTARVCAAVNEVAAALIVAVAFDPPPQAASSGRRPRAVSTQRCAPVRRMLTVLASSIATN